MRLAAQQNLKNMLDAADRRPYWRVRCNHAFDDIPAACLTRDGLSGRWDDQPRSYPVIPCRKRLCRCYLESAAEAA